MPGPYLGGVAILDSPAPEYLSPSALRVAFQSDYAGMHYQLYRGRTLCGVTTSTSDRQIVGYVPTEEWPEWITIMAVNSANRLTDYGDRIPPRPFNRIRLNWTGPAAWATDDVDRIRITAGTTPGGAVDSSNIADEIEYAGVGAYQNDLPATQPGTGDWNLEITATDEVGNPGTALAVTAADVQSTPPDVQLDAAGDRLNYSITTGTITVSYTLAS